MKRNYVLSASFVLWLISLTLPALISSESGISPGWSILAFGWLGFAGVEDGVNFLGVIAWWANPLYLWAIARFAFGSKLPRTSSYLAVGFGSLTILLSSHAVNAVPSYSAIIGYGPGAVLWYLALLGPAYLVAYESGRKYSPSGFVVLGVLIVGFYMVQTGMRTVVANESELDRLPYYSAKRGVICSAKATSLPILERQSAIVFDSTLSQYWFDWLKNTGVSAIQRGPNEYSRAPKDSPESQEPPYMIVKPITKQARYKLLIEGGYPFNGRWVSGDGYVRFKIIDTINGKEIGHINHKRELNRKQGFCPSLTNSLHSPKQEVIKWLSPFIFEEQTK